MQGDKPTFQMESPDIPNVSLNRPEEADVSYKNKYKKCMSFVLVVLMCVF